MKSIKNVKLGFNKNAEVTVVADVEMKDENDIDSLFLCFFTILNPPLRLSIIKNIYSIIICVQSLINLEFLALVELLEE